MLLMAPVRSTSDGDAHREEEIGRAFSGLLVCLKQLRQCAMCIVHSELHWVIEASSNGRKRNTVHFYVCE